MGSSDDDDSGGDEARGKGWAVVGSSCKLFPAPANFVDASLLLPWQGDTRLMMDRFDARLLLDEERLFKKKKRKPGRPVASRDGLLDSDEAEELDRERARGLPPPPHTVRVLLRATRGAAARPPAHPSPPPRDDTRTDHASQQPAVEPPLVDPALHVPADMAVPTTRQQVEVIARTAAFLHAQGPQMEILMRTKQAGNPKFIFLTPGTAHHAFFRHMLGRIKEGYKTGFEPKAEPPAAPKADTIVAPVVPAKAAVVRRIGPVTGSLVGGSGSDSDGDGDGDDDDDKNGNTVPADSDAATLNRKRKHDEAPSNAAVTAAARPATWLVSAAPTARTDAGAVQGPRKRPKLAFTDAPSVVDAAAGAAVTAIPLALSAPSLAPDADVLRRMVLIAQRVVASSDATLLQTLVAKQASNPQYAFLNPWHPLHAQFQATLSAEYAAAPPKT